MRNIFDQYESPENRLTHALACCLSEDRRLLRRFIQWTAYRQPKKDAQLSVVEQHVPGQPVRDSDEADRLGLPDMWIHDDENWSLIVESKVASPVNAAQLHGHLRTARRNGFENFTLLVISPQKPTRRLSGLRYTTWTEVFRWMRREAGTSEWALRFADYIQIAEEQMAANGYLGDKTLTEFDGIHFDDTNPYSYREAKRVLRPLMTELRKRKDLIRLGMDPKGEGKHAIRGRAEGAVWDFIPLKTGLGQGHTRHPHLTIAIQDRRLLAVVILPNGVPAGYRRNLIGLGIDGLRELVAEVEKGITRAVSAIDGAYPWIEIVQRRYPSLSSPPIHDARLEFNVRTAVPRQKSKVRPQPQWLEAAYNALANKRSNLQLAIGASVPYGSKLVQSRKVIDMIAAVWLACHPWVRQVLGEGSTSLGREQHGPHVLSTA